MARIPDDRLQWLSDLFKPKKTTATTIEFMDMPGLLADERHDNPRRLSVLREAGGLLVLLNGFAGGDLAGELTRFRTELALADLEIVTNRITKIDDQMKKPKPAKEKEALQQEQDVLKRLAALLEEGKSASTLTLKESEEKSIRSFQLLTLKPEGVLVNIGDDRIGKPLPADLLALAPGALAAPAKLEMELADLSEEDRQAFMQDLGVTGFSRDATLRSIFAGMGRMVFFTAGHDECRSWGLPVGADAVEAAGQIHTDLAKNFVRARVVSYEDFHRVGSLKEAKTQGVLREESKTYVVKDGDIIEIL
jgi:ribosome-binding ATPase YchF (GTP1/OBG family)